MDLLSEYPVQIKIPVAWGEMDTFGHVNNVAYIRYFESVRIAYLHALQIPGFLDGNTLGPILASIGCRFKLPLVYPDMLTAGARVTDVQADRFTLRHCVASGTHGRIAADGDGVLVGYDYRLKQKAPLPEAVRRRIDELEAG